MNYCEPLITQQMKAAGELVGFDVEMAHMLANELRVESAVNPWTCPP